MLLSLGALLATSCGDSGGRDSDSAASSTTPVTVSASATEASASASATEGSSSGDPSASGSESASTTVGVSESASDSDRTSSGTTGPEPATSSGSTDATTGEPSTTSDSGDPCDDQQGGQLDFSYIWVANSAEGTVSKINTINMIEEGRYRVRPDSAGNPSRTSVNLRGDVAIANRYGGVTKIFARVDDCIDINLNGAIDTSTGKFDVRDWGVEECIAWYADFPQYNVMRPMAWSPGEFNEATCAFENQRAWTTGAVSGQPGSVHALMLNGETGAVDADVPVPEIASIGAGPYGGAVDAEGNFWFHTRDGAMPFPLVRVDGETFEHQIFSVPPPVAPYGITIDTNGRVWLAGYQGGIARFDYALQTWDVVEGTTGLGIQEDANGRMWIAIYPWGGTIGAWGLDINTMQQVGLIDLTGAAGSSRGISIDFNGYVWVVEEGSNAFRVNPDDNSWEVYNGLTGAYTYSDMTGWGLKNIIPG